MMKEISFDVLVFKTNVYRDNDLQKVSLILNGDARILRWNIDTQDIDNVLRIEADHMTTIEIQLLLQNAGFICEELPD